MANHQPVSIVGVGIEFPIIFRRKASDPEKEIFGSIFLYANRLW